MSRVLTRKIPTMPLVLVSLAVVLCSGMLLSCRNTETNETRIPVATTVNNENCRLLLVHSRMCNLQGVKYLAENGNLVNCTNLALETPIMMAARSSCEEEVDLLIAAGADSQAKAAQGENALFYAALSGSNPIVRRLLAENINPNIETNDLWTPLMASAASGHSDVVSTLVDAGAEVDWKVPDGEISISSITLASRCEARDPDLPTKSDEGLLSPKIDEYEVSFVNERPVGGCYPEIAKFLRQSGSD